MWDAVVGVARAGVWLVMVAAAMRLLPAVDAVVGTVPGTDMAASTSLQAYQQHVVEVSNSSSSSSQC
jgi:hypothetical protein